MAATVTPDLTVISLCEADDWDGGLGALDPESMIQGLNCLTFSYPSAGLRAVTMKTIAPSVLTGKSIYGWLTFARLAMLEIEANGGLRFRVEDATYFAEWYVGGNDTSPTSGWYPYTCNCAVHPNRHGTLPDVDDANEPAYGAIIKVGWRVNLVFKGIVKWDAFRFGTGLSVKGGTIGDPATFTNIYDEDNHVNNKYGVLVRSDSIFFLQGQLKIGSVTPGEATYFKDTSKVVVFPDRKVGTFYEITLQGNTTEPGNTKIFFGTKSGVRGISGCVVRSAGAAKYKITATNTYITELGFYGCTFFDADTISLPVYSATREVLDCTFEVCGEVLASTCIVKYSTFIAADNRGIRIDSTSHNITECKFIDCIHATHINLSSEDPAVAFSNLVFSGSNGSSKWDIEHSVAGALKVTYSGSSNPVYVDETGGGSTTLAASATLKMVVKNEAGNFVVGAFAYIDNNDIEPYIMNTTTDGSGEASVLYSGSPLTDSRWRVRKYGYKSFKQLINVAAADITLPITLVVDPQQS